MTATPTAPRPSASPPALSSKTQAGRVDPTNVTDGMSKNPTTHALPTPFDPEAFASAVFARCAAEKRTLYQFAAVHPVLSFQTIRAIRRLPVLQPRIAASSGPSIVSRLLNDQPRGRMLTLGAAAVLVTPDTPGTYLDGAGRATVRRKVRAAKKNDVSVRRVEDHEREGLLDLANAHEQNNERAVYRVEQPSNDDLLEYDLWLAAFQGDRPIMVSVTPYAGEWAVLRYFRTLEPSPAASDARYLMTDALAEELARRGVRYLVDTARPHWLPNGLRHFQRMVGFRLMRVRKPVLLG